MERRWAAAGGGSHDRCAAGVARERSGPATARRIGAASSIAGGGERRCCSPRFATATDDTAVSRHPCDPHPLAAAASVGCAEARLVSQCPCPFLSQPNSNRVPWLSWQSAKPHGITAPLTAKIASVSHTVKILSGRRIMPRPVILAHRSAKLHAMWTWRLLRAGAFRLDGGGMFGVVPRTIWSGLVRPDEHNRIPLQTNCLLLEDGSHRVLVETGFGDKWTDKERGFYDLEHRSVVDALAEAGCAPGELDLVIVTHLHFDHAAALTRLDEAGEPVPTFPDAPVVVQRIEWEDALANKTTMTRTYLRSHLDPSADRVRLIEGDVKLLPGLLVRPMPGHTWGQQAVLFDDGDGWVCFPADVMPTVNHAAPAFNMAYDMLPVENMRSKAALLERAAKERWRLVLDHEPGHPIVRPVQDPDRPGRFRLEEVDAAG